MTQNNNSETPEINKKQSNKTQEQKQNTKGQQNNKMTTKQQTNGSKQKGWGGGIPNCLGLGV